MTQEISIKRFLFAAACLAGLAWCFVADCRYHGRPDHLAHEAPLGEWLIGPARSAEGPGGYLNSDQ